MNQHRNDDVISEDEVLAHAENRVPKYQQVEEVELAAEQQTQPATENKEKNCFRISFRVKFNSHPEQRQRNLQLQEVIVQVEILFGENLISNNVELVHDFNLRGFFDR